MDSSSGSNSAASGPDQDELEVVIFGPGVGECVLLHLGNGEWFVIDSCKFPGARRPAAIDYLEQISVDPSAAIKRILATHWHDDHVRGLGDILRQCPNAKFGMSGALAADQFFQLVFEVEAQNKLVSGTSTASEFADVLDQLERRGHSIAAPDIFANDGSMLFRGGYQNSAFVQALSPSAATIASANTQVIASLLTSQETRRFKRFAPNDLSVAVHVSAGPVNLLIGADLENTEDPAFGWKAVLASPLRPADKGTVLKVGHHGSITADNRDVWREMLEPNPVSVVTPFSRQRVPLPSDEDVSRIKTKTDRLYATTWPPSMRPRKRQGVDGMIAGAVNVRKSMNRKPGFVRVRFNLQDTIASPKVELFGSARHL